MKKILPLVIISLLLAGCATPNQGNVDRITAMVLDALEKAQQERESDPPVPPLPPVPDDPPAPPVPSDVFVTDAGVQIPSNKIDASSGSYLWKPVAEGGGTSVVLLPARFVGNVKALTVNGAAFKCTTRDYDLSNSPAWPNGARDHWRGPVMTGQGRIGALLLDGTKLLSPPMDLSKRQNGNWELTATDQQAGEPPSPPVVAGNPVSFSGSKLTLIPGLSAKHLAIHKGGLDAGGIRAAGSGTTWTIPPEYANGTAQVQRDDMMADIDLRGNSGVLSAIYTQLPIEVWPEGVSRDGWRVVHANQHYKKWKR